MAFLAIFSCRLRGLFILNLIVGFLASLSYIVLGLSLQAFATIVGIGEGGIERDFFTVEFVDFSSFSLWFAGVIFFYGLCGWAQQLINIMFNEEFSYYIRCRHVESFLFAPIFERTKNDTLTILGEALTRSGGFVSTAGRLISVMIQIICLGLFLLFSNPFVLAVSVLVIFPMVLGVKMLARFNRRYSDFLQTILVRFNNKIRMLESNKAFFHISGLSRSAEVELKENFAQYRDGFFSLTWRYVLGNILPGSLGLYILVVFFFYASQAAGSLPIDVFFILYQLLRLSSEAFGLRSSLAVNGPSFRLMFNHLEFINSQSKRFYKKQESGSESEQKYSIDKSVESITCRDAMFGYVDFNGHIHPGTATFSFDAGKGDVIVLSGPSGCGKSSGLYGILGLIELTSGLVEINGFDINRLDKKWLFDHVAYVGADPVIIDGSVSDNLRFGVPKDVSIEDLIAVLRLVKGEFLIDSDGHVVDRFLVSTGEGLSSGQKQRIALARALLRKPSVLVFDEATSNLDSQTERAIFEALIQLPQKPIILIASHGAIPTEFATQVCEVF